MAFDPVELAERFVHDVVEDVEAAAKHKQVRAVLLSAAEALLPELDLPEDQEDVVAFLEAAGEVVHEAIDVAAAKKVIATESNVPAPPQGYAEADTSPADSSAAGAEAPSAAGSQAVDGAPVVRANSGAPPAN